MLSNEPVSDRLAYEAHTHTPMRTPARAVPTNALLTFIFANRCSCPTDRDSSSARHSAQSKSVGWQPAQNTLARDRKLAVSASREKPTRNHTQPAQP